MKKTGFLLAILMVSIHATAQWPQFRGPETNMVVASKGLPTVWNDSTNVKWTYSTEGSGWSSPIILNGKVYIASAVTVKKVSKPTQMGPPPAQANPPAGGQPPQGNPPAQGQALQAAPQGPAAPAQQSQQDEDTSYMLDLYRWEVTCIDLASGKEDWKRVAKEGAPRIKSHDGNGYASETPVTDGSRLYVYFGMTGLYCYDLKGNLLWSKDFGAYKSLNGWGTGASPVVYNDILYLQIDNEVNSFLVALDAATGNEKWRVSRKETTSYSTPFIWKNKLRTELITCALTVRSYDPTDGKLLWEMKLAGDRSIPSPSATADLLFVGNPGGMSGKSSLFAVKPGASGNISLAEGSTSYEYIAWANLDAPTGNPSPLLYKGYIYILSSRGGEFSCINAADGTLLYKKKIEGVQACWSSPWVVNDVIYFYDERGITKQVKPGPQFELLPVQNKLSDKFWASIAVENDTYIFKGVKRLFCVGE